jgi:enolase-phosphatase E1
VLRTHVRLYARTHVNGAVAPADINAILLDIEGTITPIRFVYDVLFPYARTHLAHHIEQHVDSPEYDRLFEALRQEHASDAAAATVPETRAETGFKPVRAKPVLAAPVPDWVDTPLASRLASVAAYCRWLMDCDRKSTPLKALQGEIWEQGYVSGELVGEVFADVRPAFERWHARRLPVGIFSSGSVLAQQLLFRYSSAGDLTKFLDWYFDTSVGAKSESASYRRIAGSIGIEADRVLFVSDATRELEAARSTGMHTRFAIRPGNAPSHDGGFNAIHTFDELG